MSCDRCKDIHNAQNAGLTGKSCECSCHAGYFYQYPIICDGGSDITGTTCISYSTCSDGNCSVLNLNNE
jgi:hypothetical protein